MVFLSANFAGGLARLGTGVGDLTCVTVFSLCGSGATLTDLMLLGASSLVDSLVARDGDLIPLSGTVVESGFCEGRSIFFWRTA